MKKGLVVFQAQPGNGRTYFVSYFLQSGPGKSKSSHTAFEHKVDDCEDGSQWLLLYSRDNILPN